MLSHLVLPGVLIAVVAITAILVYRANERGIEKRIAEAKAAEAALEGKSPAAPAPTTLRPNPDPKA